MNYEQKRQYIKNVALNKIQKIVAGNMKFDPWASETYTEQELYEIKDIIKDMTKELHAAKMKHKLKKEKQNVVEQ